MRYVKEPMPLSIAQHATAALSLSRREGDDVQRMLHKLMERLQTFPPSASWSCQAYDRLLAGETVSWLQILQDHPLLGSITVSKLIEAGVVEATLAPDAKTATSDVWLTLRSCANDEGGRANEVTRAMGL